MRRNIPFTPTRLTERVGEAISAIGDEFTIWKIIERCPDLSYARVEHLLDFKIEQGVVERIGTARYRLLKKPFAQRTSMGLVSLAVWDVLREHHARPLCAADIVRLCQAKLKLPDPMGLPKAISVILSIWRRRDALVRTTRQGRVRYRLAAGIVQRPLTTMRGLHSAA